MKQTQNKQETTAHKNKNKTSVQNLEVDSETNESEWTGKAENRDHFALHPQKRGGLLGTGTGGGGGGRKSEGSTADTAQKRPERPWTAARTSALRNYRRQRLVHCAITVSTAVLG